jgi:predicted PurR-regulated permease PerM
MFELTPARVASDEPALHAPVRTPRPVRPAFFWLATVVLIVVVLSRAEAILVPLALAVVLAFALSPTVTRLERVLRRGGAVAVVVLAALGLATGVGYLLERQLVDLSSQMTKYSDSIQRKLLTLQGSANTGLAGFSKSIDRVVHNLDQRVATDEAVRPVRLVPAETPVLERIETALTPVVAPLARSLVILVLVVFFLVKREDLRDRVIRLMGRGNLTLTTRALDEAGDRISRFLTHQSAINAGVGIVVGIGLFWIGIPYAPLWGFLAAVLRFVPVVGIMMAMLVPSALAFAQFAGWWPLVSTLALFLGSDVLAAYVVEPVVIGAKTGVSSMAMLASAIFWSWLWGPVGLVLSTPLTVCLAVLGKHVSRLSYLSVVLGDEPALEDDLMLYQRLLSGDIDEAHDILDKRFRVMSRGRVFDEVVVPALLQAESARARNEISEGDHQHVLRAIRALVEAVPGSGREDASSALTEVSPEIPRRIVGVSARTMTDEAIWDMWAQLFRAEKIAVESVGSAYLSSEMTISGDKVPPDLICVNSIPPGGLAQARYICRRLRAKLPRATILVIRPGVQEDEKESAKRLLEDGANIVCATLEEARTAADQWLVGNRHRSVDVIADSRTIAL